MNQKTRTVTLCFFFLILNGCAQSPRQGYTPPGGEFSFVPPENWVMREVPGFKYQFAFGERVNDFTLNMNFVDGPAPSTLDEFVAGNIQALQKTATDEGTPLKIVSQTQFTTDSKRSGAKVVTETEYNKNPIRQTFYFFEGKGDNKFVITCSVPAAGGEDYEKKCDSSIRTFKTSED
jgi:hypothetical protein